MIFSFRILIIPIIVFVEFDAFAMKIDSSEQQLSISEFMHSALNDFSDTLDEIVIVDHSGEVSKFIKSFNKESLNDLVNMQSSLSTIIIKDDILSKPPQTLRSVLASIIFLENLGHKYEIKESIVYSTFKSIYIVENYDYLRFVFLFEEEIKNEYISYIDSKSSLPVFQYAEQHDMIHLIRLKKLIGNLNDTERNTLTLQNITTNDSLQTFLVYLQTLTNAQLYLACSNNIFKFLIKAFAAEYESTANISKHDNKSKNNSSTNKRCNIQ